VDRQVESLHLKKQLPAMTRAVDLLAFCLREEMIDELLVALSLDVMAPVAKSVGRFLKWKSKGFIEQDFARRLFFVQSGGDDVVELTNAQHLFLLAHSRSFFRQRLKEYLQLVGIAESPRFPPKLHRDTIREIDNTSLWHLFCNLYKDLANNIYVNARQPCRELGIFGAHWLAPSNPYLIINNQQIAAFESKHRWPRTFHAVKMFFPRLSKTFQWLHRKDPAAPPNDYLFCVEPYRMVEAPPGTENADAGASFVTSLDQFFANDEDDDVDEKESASDVEDDSMKMAQADYLLSTFVRVKINVNVTFSCKLTCPDHVFIERQNPDRLSFELYVPNMQAASSHTWDQVVAALLFKIPTRFRPPMPVRSLAYFFAAFSQPKCSCTSLDEKLTSLSDRINLHAVLHRIVEMDAESALIENLKILRENETPQRLIACGRGILLRIDFGAIIVDTGLNIKKVNLYCAENDTSKKFALVELRSGLRELKYMTSVEIQSSFDFTFSNAANTEERSLAQIGDNLPSTVFDAERKCFALNSRLFLVPLDANYLTIKRTNNLQIHYEMQKSL
jgi:hypothetical protein